MRTRLILGVALSLVATVCASPAFAEVVLQDDFEAHTLGDSITAGSPEIGDSYAGAGLQILDATSTPPGSGSQFVGSNGESGAHYVAMYITLAQSAAAAGKVVEFTADVYLSSTSSNPMELAAFTGNPAWYDGRSFDVELRTDGTVRYYDGSAWQNGTGTYTTNAWIPFKVVADFSAHTFDASLNGTKMIDDGAMPDEETFRHFFVGVGTSGGFFDNVSVSIVPEPSSIALLCSSLVGLVAYAWRKRR